VRRGCWRQLGGGGDAAPAERVDVVVVLSRACARSVVESFEWLVCCLSTHHILPIRIGQGLVRSHATSCQVRAAPRSTPASLG
jgi:hypothetical protein